MNLSTQTPKTLPSPAVATVPNTSVKTAQGIAPLIDLLWLFGRFLAVLYIAFCPIFVVYIELRGDMGLATPARPDLAAHREAIHAPFRDIVGQLVAILGKKLTAYVAGVKDTRVIDRWSAGDVQQPYRDADRRIRLAYQIARTLKDHDSARVVQAWFMGLNPVLQDRTPIRLLRDEDIDKIGPELLNAMRAFLAGA